MRNGCFLWVLFFLQTFQAHALEEEALGIPPSIRPYFEDMMYNPANPVLRTIFSSEYVDDFKRLECVDLLMAAGANVLAIDISRMFKDPKMVRGRLKTMTYVIPEPDDPDILILLDQTQEKQERDLEKIFADFKIKEKYASAVTALTRMINDSWTLKNIKKRAKERLSIEQLRRARK